MSTVWRIVKEAAYKGSWDRPLQELHRAIGDRAGINFRFSSTIRDNQLSSAAGIICSITLRDPGPAWLIFGDKFVRLFTGELEFVPGITNEGSMHSIKVRDVGKPEQLREFDIDFVYLSDTESRGKVFDADADYSLCLLGTDENAPVYARHTGLFLPLSDVSRSLRTYKCPAHGNGVQGF